VLQSEFECGKKFLDLNPKKNLSDPQHCYKVAEFHFTEHKVQGLTLPIFFFFVKRSDVGPAYLEFYEQYVLV
jgi:hypothetical protein